MPFIQTTSIRFGSTHPHPIPRGGAGRAAGEMAKCQKWVSRNNDYPDRGGGRRATPRGLSRTVRGNATPGTTIFRAVSHARASARTASAAGARSDARARRGAAVAGSAHDRADAPGSGSVPPSRTPPGYARVRRPGPGTGTGPAHATHRHTNHSALVRARAAAVSAHNMCHNYMRQVVDTTSLRPGPPAPPQCREWRRSLVSLSHEPPTSDLHASQAAIHTHAPQPPISSLGSVRCPPTRLPHGQRDAISSHTPHPTCAEPKRTWCALELASSQATGPPTTLSTASRLARRCRRAPRYTLA